MRDQPGARVRRGIPVDDVVAAARGRAEPVREQELAEHVLDQARLVAGVPPRPQRQVGEPGLAARIPVKRSPSVTGCGSGRPIQMWSRRAGCR